MKKRLALVLIVLTFLVIPTVTYAKFDEYGYDAKKCLFIGTFDNWEAFMYGLPPFPAADPAAADVLFVTRNWSKDFDKGMFQGKPMKDGAWCSSSFYENLSGDQLGWTWHNLFIFVYSSASVEDGIPIEGMPDFYFIKDKTWLTDPSGQEIIISDSQAPFLDKAFDKQKDKLNKIKSLIKKEFKVNKNNK